MENVQNTPPHARLEIIVGKDLRIAGNGTIGNCTIDFKGCKACMIEAIASFLLRQQDFKEIINSAIRIANERRAQKEN